LIQVQKTKVDIEVAMDGIDKILQSQQLVFGLVAALPALAVTWATASYTINSSKTGGAKRQFENLNQLKSRLRYRLLTLNTIVHHDGEISHEKQCGQVLYTSWRAAQAGCSYLSDVNYKFLLKDLDIIEHDVYTRPDQLTSDLDRVFLHRYF
jgi:nuclear-control-of-ATPase protein 2